MINIRPVSDLRNKFPEIENTVLNTGRARLSDEKRVWLHGRHEHRAIFCPD